ncbi:MAG: GNAT family N-acetyltransferase [Bradymonadaceae bacterium]|nr:GNAT family N-acetyltransferase [Lujinxingiaceae bacterium]
MRETTPEKFLEKVEAYDSAVMMTPDIDHFCSSSAWIVPAHQAFLPEHPIWLLECEHGFAALARGNDSHLGTYLHPLEASWALACPLVGTHVAHLTRAFVEACRGLANEWNLLFLSGIAPQSTHFRELVHGFRRDYSMGLGSSSIRRVASLDGGVEGFFGRRSPRFRANLRRVRRRAEHAGVRYEFIRSATCEQDAIGLLERALLIEQRSWKGQSDTGIIDGPMKVFYHTMLPMLVRRDALRFVFVTLDGVDIAYCFGATFNDTFRGLQMSYDESYAEHSPGTLAQLEIIHQLCEENIGFYDLGSEMDYKKQWAEQGLETVALIVRR